MIQMTYINNGVFSCMKSAYLYSYKELHIYGVIFIVKSFELWHLFIEIF